jgi:hypothetical protein
MSKRTVVPVFIAGLSLFALSGCAAMPYINPNDPGQRALSGAAIGGAVGGWNGAAVGAAVGGVVGAVTGAATTPTTPAPPPAAGYAPPPG